MILRSKMFKKVTIVGVGLMGGSLGLAMKKNDLAKEIVGLSHKQSSLVQAVKNKAIDVALTDIPKAIKNADLVVLATPVESIIKLLSMINPHLKRGCIVTDLGSAKAEIVDEAHKVLSNPGYFVGSHPLVGSEKKGAGFAHADLFEKALCVITPTEDTNQVAKGKIKHLWTKIGSAVKEISPEMHDQALAQISHLPHLAAFGLMNAIPKEVLSMAPKGLRDVSRIAASNPQMWTGICMSNKTNVLKALDKYVECLSEFRKNIVDRNDKKLIKLFTHAKEKRESMG